jgi:hypothetical protein
MGLPANIIGMMGKKQAGYLPLTTAWIAATGETDTTILNALNTFEAGLIANSLTTKFNAIYPMVGGNSFKHSFNFINTLTFQLSFNGFWTHSATGALPNGTNANANTVINASTVLTVNNNHLSFYSRSNTAVGVAPNLKVSIGAYSGATVLRQLALYLKSNGTGNSYYQNTSGTLTQVAIGANTDSRGWFIGNKASNTIGGLTVSRNATSLGANTIAPTQTLYPFANILLSGNSFGTPVQYDDKECAMATIGTSLTSGEISTLYTLIQAFQTSLSRAV